MKRSETLGPQLFAALEKNTEDQGIFNILIDVHSVLVYRQDKMSGDGRLVATPNQDLMKLLDQISEQVMQHGDVFVRVFFVNDSASHMMRSIHCQFPFDAAPTEDVTSATFSYALFFEGMRDARFPPVILVHEDIFPVKTKGVNGMRFDWDELAKQDEDILESNSCVISPYAGRMQGVAKERAVQLFRTGQLNPTSQVILTSRLEDLSRYQSIDVYFDLDFTMLARERTALNGVTILNAETVSLLVCVSEQEIPVNIYWLTARPVPDNEIEFLSDFREAYLALNLGDMSQLDEKFNVIKNLDYEVKKILSKDDWKEFTSYSDMHEIIRLLRRALMLLSLLPAKDLPAQCLAMKRSFLMKGDGEKNLKRLKYFLNPVSHFMIIVTVERQTGISIPVSQMICTCKEYPKVWDIQRLSAGKRVLAVFADDCHIEHREAIKSKGDLQAGGVDLVTIQAHFDGQYDMSHVEQIVCLFPDTSCEAQDQQSSDVCNGQKSPASAAARANQSRLLGAFSPFGG